MKPPVAPRAPRPRAETLGHDLVIPYEEQEELASWEEPDALDPQEVEDSPQPADLSGRISERDRARARVLWIRLAIGIGVLAVLAGIAWVALFSSLLALKADAITVEGEGTYVDTAAALAIAAGPAGTPLLRLDTAAIRDELLTRPDVAEANVSRDWPDGLLVELVAREPVAAATRGEGLTLDLLGSDGVVIATVPSEEAPAGLPVLSVDTTQEGAAESVTAVLEVLAQLTPELRAQIASAGASAPHAIELVLTSGAEVRWGDAEDVELKAAVLTTLLQVPASYYDVSAPEAPLTR